MARKKDKASNGHIQELLDERKRIEQWLVRLEKAADRTPDAVRQRVRGDYQTRLTAVVAELQGFQEDLKGSLREAQSQLAAARQQEKEATEELAEAELRYAVGEFGESEWSEKKTAILDRLIGIRENVGQAEEEIGELEEVLRSIAAPALTKEEEEAATEPEIAELEEIEDLDETEEEAPPARTPPKGPPGRITLGSDLGLRDLSKGKEPDESKRDEEKEKAKAAVPAAKKEAKPQTEAFGDELAFLKALSDDGSAPPAPRAPARQQPAEPKSAALPSRGERISEGHPVSRSRPSVINQRTLKCGECGAMNLPTEWYCDRCGAELASL